MHTVNNKNMNNFLNKLHAGYYEYKLFVVHTYILTIFYYKCFTVKILYSKMALYCFLNYNFCK